MPYQNVLIAPSILAADFANLGEQIHEAEAAGANLFHVDVMDGRFVPNITMGPLVVRALRQVTNLPLDVHLMIVEPEKFVDVFAEAGADQITIHIEASPNLHRTLQQIGKAGCKVGVAINPHVPAVMLQEVMTMLDVINVMTVNPGFGGQEFISSMTSKIADLRAMARSVQREIDIQVDGGVNVGTAATAVQAGANVLIAGSGIFQHEAGIKAGIDALRTSLRQEME